MKHINTRLRKIGFSVKEFFVILLFVTVMIAVSQIWRAEELIEYQEETIVRSMMDDLRLANLYVDHYANSIRSFLVGITTRNDIYEMDAPEAGRVLNRLRKNENYISVLYAADYDGRIRSSSQALYQAVDPPVVKEMIQRAKEMPYIIQYSAPYYSPMTAGYSVCVSYAVENKIAVIETGTGYLYSNMQAVLGGSNKFFAVASVGGDAFLFSRNESGIPLKKGTYPLEVEEGLAETINGSWRQMSFCESEKIPGYHFMYSQQNIMGWRIFSFYNHSILQGYKRQVWMNVLITTMIWFSVLLVTVFFVTVFLTRPIRRLASDMDQVKNLDQLIEVDFGGEGEIVRLSQSYNHLILRIRRLVEEIRETEHKKLEYEFHMLQNQIGPHFLHNTLACIASLLRRGKTEGAQEALNALQKLLVYTFEISEKPVTLQQETEQLCNYVKIEKMRYGDCFDFTVSMEELAKEQYIPKLTLQPLVENAIFHGLIPKGGTEGRLTLTIRLRGDILHIFVCDNGVGMSPALCRTILCGKNSPKVKDRLSSVGISNVNERLKLKYGKEYGIRMKSMEGKGTVICLRIPKAEW